MKLTSITRLAILTSAIVLTMTALAQNPKQCQPAGGMLLTNLGVVDQATTMGYATGDLKGAVGATIKTLNFVGDKVVLTVQHHWVTESADTLAFDAAQATAEHVGDSSSTRYGITDYTTTLTGGTGKFAGATGKFDILGEVELGSGQLVLRYTGYICFPRNY